MVGVSNSLWFFTSTNIPQWERKSASIMGLSMSAMTNRQVNCRLSLKSKLTSVVPNVCMDVPLAAYSLYSVVWLCVR